MKCVLLIASASAILGVLVFGSVPLVIIENDRGIEIILAKDIILKKDSPNVIWSANAKDQCTCRMMCFVKPNCLTFSYNGDERTCTLLDVGPQDCSFENSPGSFLGYYTKGFHHTSYRRGSDGFIYAVSNYTANFNTSWDTCASIPGHRLGIFKTMAQYKVLQELRKEAGDSDLWVDLFTTSNRTSGFYATSPYSPQWGDKTFYADTELGDQVKTKGDDGGNNPMRYVGESFVDWRITAVYHFVCQADPLGKEW